MFTPTATSIYKTLIDPEPVVLYLGALKDKLKTFPKVIREQRSLEITSSADLCANKVPVPKPFLQKSIGGVDLVWRRLFFNMLNKEGTFLSPGHLALLLPATVHSWELQSHCEGVLCCEGVCPTFQGAAVSECSCELQSCCE